MLNAERLYHSYTYRSIFRRAADMLRGRGLSRFEEIAGQCTFQTDARGEKIRLDKIAGTVNSGRARDFDAGFRPIREDEHDRWLGIADARLRGVQMPPVRVTQAGDRYYVEDGCHRISVAKALGDETIKAVVSRVKVSGRLPWEKPAAATERQPSAKPALAIASRKQKSSAVAYTPTFVGSGRAANHFMMLAI